MPAKKKPAKAKKAPAPKDKQISAEPAVSVGKVVPEKIHFLRIGLVAGAVEASEDFQNAPTTVPKIQIDFGHRSGIDWKGRFVHSRIFVELDGQDAAGEAIGVTARYVFDFQLKVENLDEFCVKTEQGPTLRPDMGATLMGIMFSTVRGMVLERTRGTFLDGTILPVITPSELMMRQR